MAARFWVGGTGTWDAVNTANWSATSGGAGGASVPTSADNITFNASSGGGTVALGADGICTIIDFTGFTGTIDFVNTYKISCVSSGTTIIAAGTTATFSNTPRFDLTYSGAVGTRTISCGTTEANSPSFYITAGTDTIGAISRSKTLDFTGFAGTWAGNSVIFGDLVISTGMTITSSANNIWFAATSGTQKITTNGKLFDCLVNFGFANTGVATYELQDNMTVGVTRTTTLWNGTLDLKNLTLSTGLFNSSGTRTRAIAFGTGNITTTGSGTVWNTATLTGFSRTGTPTVNISNNSATAATVSTGAMTEAQALDFNYTTGTYALTDTASVYRSVNFTGFAGTLSNSVRTIFGSLTISSGMTLTAGTSATTFAATSGTQQITTNGKTLDFSITQNSPGATVQLQDNLTMGSTRQYTLTAGALNLSVGNRTLSCGFFSSSNSNTRSIAFGTGNITVTGSSATVWTTATVTNLTVSGTPTANFTSAAVTGTRTVTLGTLAEGSAFNVNITAGTDTFTFTSGGTVNNVNFTGFTGATNGGPVVYGNFTYGTGMTTVVSAGGTSTFFSATSGTKTITTNGVTFNRNVTFNGLGGTWNFTDALTMGSVNTITISAGTVNFKNGTTNTSPTWVIAGTAANQVRIGSTLAGSQATLSQASGTVSTSYLTVQDSNATGGATWNAFVDQENVDAGNNDGWDFGISPIVGSYEYTYQLRSFTQPRRF